LAATLSGVAGSAAAPERGVLAGVGVVAGVHTGCDCAQRTEENNARKKMDKGFMGNG
jgi:hypothetical protein